VTSKMRRPPKMNLPRCDCLTLRGHGVRPSTSQVATRDPSANASPTAPNALIEGTSSPRAAARAAAPARRQNLRDRRARCASLGPRCRAALERRDDLLRPAEIVPNASRSALSQGGATTCLTWVATSLLMERAESAGSEVLPKQTRGGGDLPDWDWLGTVDVPAHMQASVCASSQFRCHSDVKFEVQFCFPRYWN